MKNVVDGMVRLYRGSPRVREFDYDRRMYQDPDYYGDLGNHFLRRSDFNLLPIKKGIYMTSSPYSGVNLSGSYRNFNPLGSCCANVGYLNNLGYLGNEGEESSESDQSSGAQAAQPQPATAGSAEEESGFNLVGSIASAYQWSQSKAGKKAIKDGKENYDTIRGIGNGGSSNTVVKGFKINKVPVGTIPIDELVSRMTRIEKRLVPSEFASVGAIPQITNPSLIGAFFQQGVLGTYPFATRMKVQRYNLLRKEIEGRLKQTPASGSSGGGMVSSSGGGMVSSSGIGGLTWTQIAAWTAAAGITAYIGKVALDSRKRRR